MRDRPSEYSQELISRVANKLSNGPKTAGAVSTKLAFPQDSKPDSTVNYTLGQNYGGGARKPVKYFIKSKGTYRGPKGDLSSAIDLDGCKVSRGCFLCKGDHRDNEHHSRD